MKKLSNYLKLDNSCILNDALIKTKIILQKND